ncbi:MAG: methyltransferase [Desulfobacteraceae bacterium]|jgi:SAM-dependent methyltransferase|nr:methyltransferase [Desulfobacteraceae bacterium]
MKANISDILLAPWITGVIITAIRLKIFSILSDRELTVEEIASKCEAIPNRLKPLLDACKSLGILEFERDKYKNSHFSLVYFVEGQRFYVGDFLKIINNESLEWFQLPDLIRGKEKKIIELPELKSDYKTFITAMNSIGQLGEAEALKDMVDLSGCKSMTDAGGGSGLYSVALCQKYPDLHSTILDVKETLAVTRELIADRQEKKRITLQEGNFFKDPLGDNLDAVLLSDVMYGDHDAKILLKKAWDSLARNGVLIVRGYYADVERSGPLFGALFAVKLMVDDPQRKIMTISILEKNVREIGFKISKVTPLTEYSFVLIGEK